MLAGRRLYEDGEFKREIVQRIPRSLFDDQVRLSCGHETTTMRNDSEIHINCHQCAQRWIAYGENTRRTVGARKDGIAAGYDGFLPCAINFIGYAFCHL